MSLAHILGVFLVSATSSWLGCRYLLPRLSAAGMWDAPNHRSLHARRVPRGAGLAIAAVGLVMLAWLVAIELLPARSGGILFLAGTGFAFLGWDDDRHDRSAVLRLICQFSLAIFCVYGIGLTGDFDGAYWWGTGFVVFGFVWHVNVFNFMDGADGFAAVQAILVCIAICALNALNSHSGIALWAAAVAAATIGFLYWNWAPAKMFLGDCGSYFLGYVIAALIFISYLSGASFAALVILIAPFVTDATLTLIWRALRGQPWWRAHRSHAYQRLVLCGRAPAQVAFGLAALNVALCWPLSWLASRSTHDNVVALFAYILTGIMWASIVRANGDTESTSPGA
jgi:Fuc2NAc and GlcNAc transferase